jgi:YidC/Oxa1 family membrane protein insertase
MLDFLAPVWNLIIINPMLNLLLFLYGIIPNYGVSIILFTLIIAGLQTPLRIKSQQTMRETQAKQARLKPKLDELKKKHKDNPQALQTAQMKLYQEEGMNLFNAGCLLQLLPLPLFFGLFQVIQLVMGSTPEQVMQLPQHTYPFFAQAAQLVPVNPYLIDGLLNLASPVSTLPLPLIAIIVGLIVGTSYVQQKMMTGMTPSLDPQQTQMNQSMQLMMPLMMAFFVYNYQFGLSLYWVTFSLVSIVQQFFATGWGGLFGQSGTRQTPKPQKSSASPAANIAQLPERSSNAGNNGAEKPAAAAANTPVSKTPVASTTGSSGSKKGKKKSGKKY